MRAIDVRFAGSKADRYLVVVIDDGRLVVTPLSWYPTLAAASPKARSDWRIQGNGRGIHWPKLDLDLSVAGMMVGVPESTRSAVGALPLGAALRVAMLRGDDPAALARAISGRLSDAPIRRLIAELAGKRKVGA